MGYDVILDNNEVFINNHIFMSYNIDGGFMYKLKINSLPYNSRKNKSLERDMMNKKTIAINKIVNVYETYRNNSFRRSKLFFDLHFFHE